jgi:ABC-type bacteriocin/lantibiotic exporter with double-glycine peptidase domain
MPKTSKTSKFSKLRRITQISENHCGPAVIQMLLENIGIEVSQGQITIAAGATKTISTHGTRVGQLAQAVHKIAPQAKLWYKEKASLENLIYVLDKCNFPVGVEWQGLFGDKDEDESDDDDYGHYSVVTNIDTDRNEMIIVDPYKDFADQDRIIDIKVFLKRWWDFNEVLDPKTQQKTYKKDEQLFFVVTPNYQELPQELGMQTFDLLFAQH